MRKAAVSLFVSLYFVWAWSVFVQPLFPDINDWPNTDFNQHAVPLTEMIEGGQVKTEFALLISQHLIQLKRQKNSSLPVNLLSHLLWGFSLELTHCKYRCITKSSTIGLAIKKFQLLIALYVTR